MDLLIFISGWSTTPEASRPGLVSKWPEGNLLNHSMLWQLHIFKQVKESSSLACHRKVRTRHLGATLRKVLSVVTPALRCWSWPFQGLPDDRDVFSHHICLDWLFLLWKDFKQHHSTFHPYMSLMANLKGKGAVITKWMVCRLCLSKRETWGERD